MNSSLPFERLSDSHAILPFDCGDEDVKDYPAVKIGRLGVSKLYQHTGDGWGTKILDLSSIGWYPKTRLDAALLR